jgi:hypothetical protein
VRGPIGWWRARRARGYAKLERALADAASSALIGSAGVAGIGWAVAQAQAAEQHAARAMAPRVPTYRGQLMGHPDMTDVVMGIDESVADRIDSAYSEPQYRDRYELVDIDGTPLGVADVETWAVGPDGSDDDPLLGSAEYRARLDAAGERTRRQLDELRAEEGKPSKRRSMMVMHLLVPDDGGPMRTACCDRLLEELPLIEGATRVDVDCTCPAVWP